MKRNWYALLILLLLALMLGGAGLCVRDTAQQLRRSTGNAFACALMQDYDSAKRAYQAVAQAAQRHGRWLRLVVRRTLVDKVEETAATLPNYAQPDNQADLAVENARLLVQIDQLEAAFWGS